MAKIILDDEYRIEDNPSYWALIREEPKISSKTGKMTIIHTASYHINLKQALSSYLNEGIKGSDSL